MISLLHALILMLLSVLKATKEPNAANSGQDWLLHWMKFSEISLFYISFVFLLLDFFSWNYYTSMSQAKFNLVDLRQDFAFFKKYYFFIWCKIIFPLKYRNFLKIRRRLNEKEIKMDEQMRIGKKVNLKVLDYKIDLW